MEGERQATRPFQGAAVRWEFEGVAALNVTAQVSVGSRFVEVVDVREYYDH